MGTLILASASPRRKELLRFIEKNFEVVTSEVDETLPGSFLKEIAKSNRSETTKETPNIFFKCAMYLAKKKAEAVFANFTDKTVLGADTMVVINNRILGKPKTKQEAKEMLTCLSGKTHSVITGMCLLSLKKETTFYSETLVTFKELSEEEIKTYIETKEPFDKAGGYAIQGKAADFVKNIQGSYTNVVGLDVNLVKEKLTDY